MTDEQDDSKEFEIEMIDLGDVTEETKQLSPLGIQPDCIYGIGVKYGCGG